VPARFILSFDCEGKWGSADVLTADHRRDFTNDKLRDAYGAILAILDEYGVGATFAFAGAFSQSASGLSRIRPELEALANKAPDYLRPALRDIDETGGDGWHGATLVESVGAARTPHEIALHGVTHVPWRQMDAAFVEAELRLFKRLEGPVRDSRTFVYPRNMVAHADALAAHGFLGFRAARPHRTRLGSLLSELNLFERPEQERIGNEIVAIPAGYFLNWQSGARRLVPPAITTLRAKRLLDRAAETDAIVHYWLHPENIATAPSTLELLDVLVREVAARRDAGRCHVLTQLGYCRSIESPT
jgi:peptidoglycan/xylan/chitin deacetylase (PgdA/CDA1 family)